MPPKTLNKQEMRLTLIERIHHNARYALGIGVDKLTNLEAFEAIALTLRENLIDGMLDTEARYTGQGAKRLYYLSMEFLMGRALGNGLYNLGLLEICRSALSDMGIDLEEVRQAEPDAALGNGGLGRLAACFWIPWPVSVSPVTVTGFCMNSGCFDRRSATAIKRKSRTTGMPWGRLG